MRKAAELDLVTGGLRNVGGRMFPMLTSGMSIAGSMFNPMSLAITPLSFAASLAARKGADVRQLGKANALARLIEDPKALESIVDPRLVGAAGLAGGISAQ